MNCTVSSVLITLQESNKRATQTVVYRSHRAAPVSSGNNSEDSEVEEGKRGAMEEDKARDQRCEFSCQLPLLPAGCQLTLLTVPVCR
eukprot:COSAG02_NODE_12503_length_1535_cov_121.965877_2_plen_87_part_00